MRRLVMLAAIVSLALCAVSDSVNAAPQGESASDSQNQAADDTPEARFNRRFPQKARVGDLIGLPVLNDKDLTLGHIRKIVRTPEGKIRLIVSYSKWFG